MKRTILLLTLLAALALASGYMMSEASWIGRVGITFFHKEYNLLKIWWQGAAAVYIIYLLFFFLHTFLQQRMRAVLARIFHFILLLAATAGLYLTYNDFHHTFTHHLLGWRFHYGFYLVWIGWMLICLFFITKKKPIPVTNSDRTATTVQ